MSTGLSLIKKIKKYKTNIRTKKTTHHNIKYREFDKARTFARSLKLSNVKEWKEEYCRSLNKPQDIPTNAYQKYKNSGWKGWADFLGKE